MSLDTDISAHQQAAVNGLYALAALLDERRDLIDQYFEVNVYIMCTGAEDLAEKGRLLGTSEKYADDHYIGFKRSFGPVKVDVFTTRSAVCERVQVGEKVEEFEIPESDLADGDEIIDHVNAEPRVIVKRTVPVFETRCPDSLLQ